MRKIIMDVDTGSDDAVALMLAAAADELELIAVATTYNFEYRIDNITENTLRVLELVAPDVPVYEGSHHPVCKNLSARDKNSKRNTSNPVGKDGKVVAIHQEYLDLPVATKKAEDMDAVSFYLKTLRGEGEKYTLVMTGGMTNLALALRINPNIKNRIEEIVLMGGGVNITNVTTAAESNFYRDPEAAKILLKSGCKVTIVPLDATHSAMFDLDDAKKFSDLGTAPCTLTGDLISQRALAYQANGQTKTPQSSLHDAITVGYLINPEILPDVRRESCDIEIAGGIADGMLVVDNRLLADKTAETYVAYKADKEKFMDLLYSNFKKFTK